MSDYTIVNLEDVDDILGDYPGEMQPMTAALRNEQVAITHRRMPQHTGGKGGYGHRHKTQEEIYYVVSGRLEFKLGDEVVELGPGSAVRAAPQCVRSVWNERPEDAHLLIISVKIDDPAGDAETIADFWPA
jgi:mannose-6-phosphate isomerase-like protein (cupin superfamily)